MTEKVTKLALTSRIIVLLLQLLSNQLLPDHQPDVFRAPAKACTATATESLLRIINITDAPECKGSFLDKTINFFLHGLRHWDGEYFLHIAEHGYSYENSLAFYPLYPMAVRVCAKALYAVSSQLGLGVSMRSWALLAAVCINIYCFCRAASCLYELTQRIFGSPSKSWNAALFFCFNPASIFFTAAYSESIFCWLSLQLMLECVTEMRTLRLTTALALGIVARSNGLVNVGFPLYFYMRRMILRPAHNMIVLVFKFLLALLVALLPLTIFYFYAFKQFCASKNPVAHEPEVASYGYERSYVLAGKREPQNSPWCEQTFPFPYSYVQSHYWKVGFMRYYELKQIPNFMLAFPVLCFIFYHCFKYFQKLSFTVLPLYPLRHLLDEFRSFPFFVHALFLALFCTFYVNIQISTRLLCSSSPVLYWLAADYMPYNFDQVRLHSKNGALLASFGLYCVLGTIMFSNNLPWT